MAPKEANGDSLPALDDPNDVDPKVEEPNSGFSSVLEPKEANGELLLGCVDPNEDDPNRGLSLAFEPKEANGESLLVFVDPNEEDPNSGLLSLLSLLDPKEAKGDLVVSEEPKVDCPNSGFDDSNDD